VNAWTVDDPARIGHLAELGVHGIITNVPAIARRTLRG
jgi:glycerophosphoryl diester phosphodiesterase